MTRWRLLPPDCELGWTPFAWLIYFPTLFLRPVIDHSSPAVWMATIVVSLIFLPLYFRGFWARGSAENLWIIAAIAVLAMLLEPFNSGAPVLTIYAASFAGAVRPTRRAAQLIW